jgi:hexosaminidase
MARLIATLLWCSSLVAGDLLGIPTVPFVKSNGSLKLSSLSRIVVDSKYCESIDTAGHTLIPTTLLDYANTFASDLESTGHHVKVVTGEQVEDGSIFLTIANSSDFVDAAGRWTSEAYGLEVSDNQITINGASSLGAWWATRSIFQQGILYNGTIATGHGVDAPGWGTRGIMVSVLLPLQ